jgi:[acyl-carrier-protein] S-malonyltransferase
MKFAFVFPGQGSQSVGMMDVWSGYPAAMRVIAEASAALGEDLGALMALGPAEQLNLTTNTQPAMLTAGIAMFEAWRAAGGPTASLMAGHSLGEYAALTAAGSLSLDDAVRLVRIRADAMQAAVPVGTGAMAAVLGLEDDAVRAACAQAAQGQVVEAVNFNAPVIQRPCSVPYRRPRRRAPNAPCYCPSLRHFTQVCSNPLLMCFRAPSPQ